MFIRQRFEINLGFAVAMITKIAPKNAENCQFGPSLKLLTEKSTQT